MIGGASLHQCQMAHASAHGDVPACCVDALQAKTDEAWAKAKLHGERAEKQVSCHR